MSHFYWLLLQAPEYSHMKVSLLQDSFVRELWKKLGKQTYIEKVHPLVITNLYNSPNKITASAASIVLIGSSEELGIPMFIRQVLAETFFGVPLWYHPLLINVSNLYRQFYH